MRSDHRRQAKQFLADQLAADAPRALAHEADFEGQPLENEGDMSVFSFRASIGGEPEGTYWVVVGETQPNYYPDWQLTADMVYDLHLGTRFMLVMQVASVPHDQLPGDLGQRIREFIATVAPGEPVSAVEPAAAFRVEDQIHAVCRARIAEEQVYVLGLDCPPGIYRDVHLPPHVVFRRHIGQLIRREAASGDEV